MLWQMIKDSFGNGFKLTGAWHEMEEPPAYGPEGKKKIIVKPVDFGTDEQDDVPEDPTPKLDEHA